MAISLRRSKMHQGEVSRGQIMHSKKSGFYSENARDPPEGWFAGEGPVELFLKDP